MTPLPIKPAWLTLDQAAAHTQLSKDTLERWVESKYLKIGIHYGGSGRLRRFDPEMLDAAVRFQHDAEAHEQAIARKQQQLFGRKRA